MSPKRFLLAGLFLAFCGWFFTSDHFTSEEQQVRATFREMLDHATIAADIPAMERLFIVKKLITYFSSDVTGVYRRPGEENVEQQLSPRKIENMLMGGYRAVREIRPKIVSERIETDVGMVVTSKVRIYGDARASGDSFLEEFDLSLQYAKIDGSWKITSIQATRIRR